MSATSGDRRAERRLSRDLEPVLLLTALLVILTALAIVLGSSSPGT